MNILKVWDAEYPWDVRAEKVMRTLTEAGHGVHLVARNRRRDPEVEDLDECRVHRMRPWRMAGRRLDAASQFPAPVNPRWSSLMARTARTAGADVILVRDLPLTPVALRVGRRLGLPVVMDMAENYGAMIQDLWDAGTQGPFDWLIRNPALVRRVERYSLPRLDHVIVVVEESGERLEEEGLPGERITVVCNTPWPSRIPAAEDLAAPAEAGPLRLVYLGLLEKPRGVGTVLDGLALLGDEDPPWHLDVIGGGRDAEAFREMARRHGFGERVEFHGVLPYEEALAVFRRAHVGLVPHWAVESWHTTIPNKLFDYMSHALPVITSDARPAARIVEEEGVGVVFRSRDAEDFARAVREVTDAEVRARMGRAGREAVTRRYNWATDGARLVGALEEVVARGRRGRVESGA